jgi:hypothetical protein
VGYEIIFASIQAESQSVLAIFQFYDPGLSAVKGLVLPKQNLHTGEGK